MSDQEQKQTTQNVSSKPDELVKGGKKRIELTEDELKKISGGNVSPPLRSWI
jgi:bacteriocin-like protein